MVLKAFTTGSICIKLTVNKRCCCFFFLDKPELCWSEKKSWCKMMWTNKKCVWTGIFFLDVPLEGSVPLLINYHTSSDVYLLFQIHNEVSQRALWSRRAVERKGKQMSRLGVLPSAWEGKCWFKEEMGLVSFLREHKDAENIDPAY